MTREWDEHAIFDGLSNVTLFSDDVDILDKLFKGVFFKKKIFSLQSLVGQ